MPRPLNPTWKERRAHASAMLQKLYSVTVMNDDLALLRQAQGIIDGLANVQSNAVYRRELDKAAFLVRKVVFKL